MKVTIEAVALHNLPEHNAIVGQAHFIKTVEDIHEAMVNCVPNAQFGVAFCEASGKRLIRKSGTNQALVAEAVRMAELIAAGHVFVVVVKDLFPINVKQQLAAVPEVVDLFCASANPLQVVVAQTGQGRGVMGVIDGETPLGVEDEAEVKARQAFVRQIGYKL
jgi:uncharacterized protein